MEVIEEFLDQSGVAEWMHELAGMIKKSVRANILDDPTVPPSDVCEASHNDSLGLCQEVPAVYGVSV